jgi:23S rRNA (pseudouridine1915-N3)-methyltransferase
MKITILAVGTRLQQWVYDGVAVYTKRMPAHLQLQVREIPAAARTARGSKAAAREQEGERLLREAATADVTIALDETGKALNSLELATEMQRWLLTAPHVAMLVGGPDGLPEACKTEADWLWSLSKLTLPHGLVRVVLAEQLYRAWTILQRHPYHRR